MGSGMRSCGQRLLRWQQMTLWFKQCTRAVDSYGSNESFITVDHILVL